jgi:hypothetical protein
MSEIRTGFLFTLELEINAAHVIGVVYQIHEVL